MVKFKVGDRVKIKDSNWLNSAGVPATHNYKGEIHEIVDVRTVLNHLRVFTLDNLPGEFIAQSLEVVPVEPPHSELPFKVGDLVVGNMKANKYKITRQGWVGRVTRIVNDTLFYVRGCHLDTVDDFEVDIDCFEHLKIRFQNGGYIKFEELDNKLFEQFLNKHSEGTKMKLQIEVKETYRIDKSCNKQIPTMTTTVITPLYSGKAVCDKENYERRQGVLEALANALCDGNFDRVYNKMIAAEKKAYAQQCKCSSCGKSYDNPEEARKCEQSHIERKIERRQRYIERKEAKDRLAEMEREDRIEQYMKEIAKEKKADER